MVNMTVCSNWSISAMVTRRHKCAICLGSDCSRNNKLPYVCVLSSLGKVPSERSAASSRWSATSLRCRRLVLLYPCVHELQASTSSSAIRFCTNNAIRESRYLTSFSNTKFFFDWEDILALSSRKAFCAAFLVSSCIFICANKASRTTSEVVFNLQLPRICIHRQIERSDRISLRRARRSRAIVRCPSVRTSHHW